MKASFSKHLRSLIFHFLYFAARDPFEWAGRLKLMGGEGMIRGSLAKRTAALQGVCSVHQMRQRTASGRAIGDPAEQFHAFAKAGMFDTAPFTRNLSIGCGSVAA